MHEIETDRLLHRQIELKDRFDFYNLLEEPTVLKYCYDLPSPQALERLFSARLPAWEVNSVHWLCLIITDKSSGSFIGVNGFVKSRNSAEIGFLFLPKYFGRGFATESLTALVEYAKGLQIEELSANITEGNIASVRVVEKCGFSLSKREIDSVSIGGSTYDNLEYRKIL